MKNKDQEVEDNWNDTWKDILIKDDGTVDIEQLKKELFDFSEMIDRMVKVTCAMTRDRLSKPTYPPHILIGEMELAIEEDIKDRIKDDKSNGHCSFCGTTIYV